MESENLRLSVPCSASAFPVQVHFVMLHAIILTRKTSTTKWPRTYVFPFSSMRSVVTGQVSQSGESPPTSFAHMVSLLRRLGFGVCFLDQIGRRLDQIGGGGSGDISSDVNRHGRRGRGRSRDISSNRYINRHGRRSRGNGRWNGRWNGRNGRRKGGWHGGPNRGRYRHRYISRHSRARYRRC